MIQKAWQIYKAKIAARWHPFHEWLQQNQERYLSAKIATLTTVVCLMVLLTPSKAPESTDHEHPQQGEEHDHKVARIEIDPKVLEEAAITLEDAQAIQIKPYISVRGQIIENANYAMNIKPRFSGIVRSISKDFGDTVRKGDTLLVIENASTRSSYAVRSTVDGIVADRRVVNGAFAPENESILRVVNLDSVWFQGKAPIYDAVKLKAGFKAQVKDRLLGAAGTGTIIYVSPTVEEDSQASDVRIELENKDRLWMVGSFAETKIELDPIDAKVAVRSSAIQTIEGKTVVFIKDGSHLISKEITTGQSDDEWTEVLSGIDIGESYVRTNSFLVKAELLKSTAAHEH